MNCLNRLLLIFTTLFLMLTAQAQEKAMMTKTDYLKKINGHMTQGLCATYNVFKQCYPFTPPECEINLLPHVEACVKIFSSQLSDPVTSESGGQFGVKVAMCASKDFEKKYKRKRKNSAACSEALKKANVE